MAHIVDVFQTVCRCQNTVPCIGKEKIHVALLTCQQKLAERGKPVLVERLRPQLVQYPFGLCLISTLRGLHLNSLARTLDESDLRLH